MPAISITYSPNLTDEFDPQKLADALVQCAHELGVFPAWGVRAFVTKADVANVADGGSDYGFVQVAVRIAPGRRAELQTKITESFFDVLQSQLGSITKCKLGFAVDLEEFKRQTYRSGGSLSGSPTA